MKGECIPVGCMVSKTREDQSIGDPFRVNGAEFPSAALRFLSNSSPVGHPEGDGGTERGACVRRSTQREEEKDTGATAMLPGQ